MKKSSFVCAAPVLSVCVLCVTGRRAGMPPRVCAEDKFQVWKNSFGLDTRTTEQHVSQVGGGWTRTTDARSMTVTVFFETAARKSDTAGN